MPSRTCVICRRTCSKAVLFRLTESGGVLKADPRGDKPGRGAYVCSKRCLEEGFKRKDAFSRALKKKVELPAIGELWGPFEGLGDMFTTANKPSRSTEN